MTEHTDETVRNWERITATLASAIIAASLIGGFAKMGAMEQAIYSQAADIKVIKASMITALETQRQISEVRREHEVLRGRVDTMGSRLESVINAQRKEDERERKEHRGVQ